LRITGIEAHNLGKEEIRAAVSHMPDVTAKLVSILGPLLAIFQQDGVNLLMRSGPHEIVPLHGGLGLFMSKYLLV